MSNDRTIERVNEGVTIKVCIVLIIFKEITLKFILNFCLIVR